MKKYKYKPKKNKNINKNKITKNIMAKNKIVKGKITHNKTIKGYSLKNKILNNSFIADKKYLLIGLAGAIIFIVLLFILINGSKGNSNFYVSKMIIYNSADVIPSSESQYLTNLKICQYSDICIYIENNIVDSKLTDANTIKKMYIDNINISSTSNLGEKCLNYKSPIELGKYVDLSATERLDFEIIKNNKQNNDTNYETPTFYTDCSNPIVLEYLNKNIVDNFSIKNNDSKIYYNAKILKEAQINLDDINNDISFDIHITSNSNRNYVCHISILRPLEEEFLENGYSYIINSLPEDKFVFKKEK